MVIFNELLITDDRQSLIVGCQLEDLNVYSGMYIKSIYLDYYKNSETFGVPSEKAVEIFNNSDDDPDVNAVRVCVNAPSLPQTFGVSSFRDGIFYAIVTCEGDLSSSAALLSCGMDDTVDVGIIIDWKTLYEKGMQYVSKMASSCYNSCDDMPGFKLFILQWNALKLALASCDYEKLETLWEEILHLRIKSNVNSVSAGCGCHQ